MRTVPHDHTALWNDLPFAERERLSPYMIETHILHLEQVRDLIVENHKRQLRELDAWIENCKMALRAPAVFSETSTN